MSHAVESKKVGKASKERRRLIVARKKAFLDVMRAVYRNIHGIQISRDRKGANHHIDEKHLTYGEVRVDSFDQALSHASRYVKGTAVTILVAGQVKLFERYNLHVTFTKARNRACP